MFIETIVATVTWDSSHQDHKFSRRGELCSREKGKTYNFMELQKVKQSVRDAGSGEEVIRAAVRRQRDWHETWQPVTRRHIAEVLVFAARWLRGLGVRWQHYHTLHLLYTMRVSPSPRRGGARQRRDAFAVCACSLEVSGVSLLVQSDSAPVLSVCQLQIKSRLPLSWVWKLISQSWRCFKPSGRNIREQAFIFMFCCSGGRCIHMHILGARLGLKCHVRLQYLFWFESASTFRALPLGFHLLPQYFLSFLSRCSALRSPSWPSSLLAMESHVKATMPNDWGENRSALWPGQGCFFPHKTCMLE